MVNAHPTILMQYCKRHSISCPYLKDYVNSREKWLASICKFHEISRDEAKTLLLILMYLGDYSLENRTFDKKHKMVVKYKQELKNIAKRVSEIERETYNIICKDKTKDNKLSSTLSVVMQIIENDCLQSIRSYFESKGYTVGVLCFDGLMIERTSEDVTNESVSTLLERCQKYVNRKVGYDIKLDIKEMNLAYELPEVGCIVQEDKDVQERLFQLENPNFFKYCNKNLYVFNEETGCMIIVRSTYPR